MNLKFYQKTKLKQKKLTILVIIHGFPPYYMAGSEVYTWNKCRELSKKHNVVVFTRIEDEYQKPYEITDKIEDDLRIIRVNKPGRDYTFRSKYIDFKIADIFRKNLKEIKPDIIHINHLSHLTTQIVEIIKENEIPIIFTLHDFWMICIKGQLIRDDFSLCSGPSIENCIECNTKYFTSELQAKHEIQRWLTSFIKINKKIDLFIAPSRFLRDIYIKNGIPEEKIVYMDYGFDKQIINGVKKHPNGKIHFGFLGRIIPAKGVAQLIDAFNKVDHTKSELNIYGKMPSSSIYLKNRCENAGIQFKGGYDYKDISEILSNIDVLVVPSIWYENSPLVIHEAFLARIPVITSNLGGMAELVSHEKNGLLFEPGNVNDLKSKMEFFIENPELINKYSQDTYVRSIEEDVAEIERLYYKLLEHKEAYSIAQ
ncbi:MAG: glycosyltransferase family 4 protein [Promethearchaeota archaeon]